MRMDIVQDWDSKQKLRDEDGKIREGWEYTRRMGKYKKDRKILEGWEDTRIMGKYQKARNILEG